MISVCVPSSKFRVPSVCVGCPSTCSLRCLVYCLQCITCYSMCCLCIMFCAMCYFSFVFFSRGSSDVRSSTRERSGSHAPQKCKNKGTGRQGIVRHSVETNRNALQKSLCSVVVCPYLCILVLVLILLSLIC